MTSNPETIRNLIRHENEMINHRMNWFLVLQGFMFAGLAFAWDKSTALCVVFSIVGALSSVSVGTLLRCGIKAIENLERMKPEGESVIGKNRDEANKLIHFILPWNFIPVLMTLSWILLIIIRTHQ